VFAAERAAELMQDNIITDRTIIDVMAFSRLSKSMEVGEKDGLNNMLWHLIKDYDIIFYVSPEGVEIEDNGVRETNSHYRNAVDIKIKTIINVHKPFIKKLVTLSGPNKSRIEQIKATLASL
jgi:hypothetical protein